MRPVHWHPPIELSSGERTIIKHIRRAKLFVFLREHRHEVFDEAFQEELAGLYQDSHRRAVRARPTKGLWMCNGCDVNPYAPGNIG